jgi:hypothetical protein
VVVACYGFGDLDHLVAEKDFIFSRPRLNVSLTRAIKKCIVECTDAVLRPPSSVLADAAVRDFVTHLHSWQAACQANGASFMVELELQPLHELDVAIDHLEISTTSVWVDWTTFCNATRSDSGTDTATE